MVDQIKTIRVGTFKREMGKSKSTTRLVQMRYGTVVEIFTEMDILKCIDPDDKSNVLLRQFVKLYRDNVYNSLAQRQLDAIEVVIQPNTFQYTISETGDESYLDVDALISDFYCIDNFNIITSRILETEDVNGIVNPLGNVAFITFVGFNHIKVPRKLSLTT